MKAQENKMENRWGDSNNVLIQSLREDTLNKNTQQKEKTG